VGEIQAGTFGDGGELEGDAREIAFRPIDGAPILDDLSGRVPARYSCRPM